MLLLASRGFGLDDAVVWFEVWQSQQAKRFEYMRRSLVLVSGFLIGLSAIGAFAAQKSKNLTIDNPIQIGGTTLKPGSYKVVYDDSSPNTQVAFQKGKDKVATVPAQVKTLGSKTDSTSLIYTTDQNARSLQEIDFGGETYGLVLSPNASTANSGQ
jgi:hypothetical protein